jgi:beta-lactamase class A
VVTFVTWRLPAPHDHLPRMTQHHFSRRTLIAIAAAAATAPVARATTALPLPPATPFAALEKKSGGRLGVCVLDTATGKQLGHRTDERFAMCSTFKLPLAAAILREADRGKLSLEATVPVSKADLVPHAPVVEANLAKGAMTIRALAEAAQKQSDNAAANLLLKQIGGPAGFTQFFRDLGDQTTRSDRFEPEMNRWTPGDDRDTTTPAAKAATVAKILTGDVLTPASRDLLIQWMIDTKTGAKRVRAGLPQDWRAGDKTGTGYDDVCGKVNDIAIAWPPGKPPLIVTAYYNTAGPADDVSDEDQAILAKVGGIAANWINR